MSSVNEALDILTDDFYYSKPIKESKDMTNNYKLVNSYVERGKKILVKYGDSLASI